MMTPRDLPHILRLLDDPSENVRQALAEVLASYGEELGPALDALDPRPDVLQRGMILELLDLHRRHWLHVQWEQWFEVADPKERLERAMSLLAAYQGGGESLEALPQALDALAEAYRKTNRSSDPVQLAHFLFEEQALAGAREHYYHPQSSNLLHVLASHEGLPISLACIYILVGRRLGLDIQGCNWPGHFLARAEWNGDILIVDCYNGGLCTERDSFLKMQGPSRLAAKAWLDNPPTPEAIVGRVLNNLMRAYEQAHQREQSDLMLELIQDLDARINAQRGI